MSTGPVDAQVAHEPSSSRRERRDERRAAWFDRDYPRVVGVVRRVLDRDGEVDGSVAVAEEVAVDAFSRQRRALGEDAATTAVLRRALDGCLDAMVGHPGSVPVHPDLLGDDVDLDGALPLWELHEALSSMRTADRHVGLLGVAAGYGAVEVAALLERSVDDVLVRLGRVATRLGDARRLGLVVERPPEAA